MSKGTGLRSKGTGLRSKGTGLRLEGKWPLSFDLRPSAFDL